MARPRKDSPTPDARRRIIDAFWTLLETTPLDKVTAGMVAEQACCNRGTFYYHFEGMDALVFAAIGELMDESGLMQIMFCMDMDMQAELDGLYAELLAGTSPYRRTFERFALIMGTGEMCTIDAAAKQATLDVWRELLCPDGGELAPQTCVIIKTMVGGTLSFLASACARETPLAPPSGATRQFLAGRAQNALQAISESQGVPADEIRARMKERWVDGAPALRERGRRRGRRTHEDGAEVAEGAPQGAYATA